MRGFWLWFLVAGIVAVAGYFAFVPVAGAVLAGSAGDDRTRQPAAQNSGDTSFQSEPHISGETLSAEYGVIIDGAGIFLGSGNQLVVPAVPGADAPKGPAAGPSLPPSPAEASMAAPAEAVP